MSTGPRISDGQRAAPAPALSVLDQARAETVAFLRSIPGMAAGGRAERTSCACRNTPRGGDNSAPFFKWYRGKGRGNHAADHLLRVVDRRLDMLDG